MSSSISRLALIIKKKGTAIILYINRYKRKEKERYFFLVTYSSIKMEEKKLQ